MVTGAAGDGAGLVLLGVRGGEVVRAALSRDDGATADPPAVVPGSGRALSDVAAALAPRATPSTAAGVGVLAWVQRGAPDGTGRAVVAGTAPDPAAAPFGAPQVLDRPATAPTPPQVVALAGGGALVGWAQTDRDTPTADADRLGRPRVVAIDDTGVRDGPVVPLGAPGERGAELDLAPTRAGGAVAVWETEAGRLRAQVLDEVGVGDPPVTLARGVVPGSARLAGGGVATVTWVDRGGVRATTSTGRPGLPRPGRGRVEPRVN